MSMKKEKCLICNDTLTENNSYNIFNNQNVVDPSQRILHAVLESVLDKQLNKSQIQSQFICNKCQKTCKEYDYHNHRSECLKSELKQKYKTAQDNILRSNLLHTLSSTNVKLSPVPSNMVIMHRGNKIVVNKDTKKSSPTMDIQVNRSGPSDQLDSEDAKYVLKKVQFTDGCEDLNVDGDTILMEENEDGAIIRVLKLEDQSILFDQEDNEVAVIDNRAASDEELEADGNITDDDELPDQQFNIDSLIMQPKLQSMEDVFPNDRTPKDCESEVLEWTGSTYKCLLCVPTDDKEDHEGFEGVGRDMWTHANQVHNLSLWHCPMRKCVKLYSQRLLLYDHIHAEHSSEELKNFKAHTYKKYTTTRVRQQFECTDCDKKYKSASQLEEHMNIHRGMKPYSCAECGKSFTSKYTCRAHIKTHEERPRPFTCDVCEKSFYTVQNLASHKKIHSLEKKHQCLECDKMFTTQHNLDIHSIVHSRKKPYGCSHCGKGFARKREVKDHERIHTGERPYACPECNMTFNQRSNLLSHRRVTHLNEAKHSCDICHRRFKRKRLLDYHMKAAHTHERPIKCDTCDARFIYPEHYKKHKMTHTGDKPYNCEVCGKTFSSRDNRNAHRYIHSDKKPYECVVCGTGFMRKPLLYSHMLIQGHLTDTIVVNKPRIKDGEAVKMEEDCDSNERLIVPSALTRASEEEHQDGVEDVDTLEDDGSLIISSDAGTGQLIGSDQQTLVDADGQEILLANIDGEVLLGGKEGDYRLMQVQLEDGKSGWVAIKS